MTPEQIRAIEEGVSARMRRPARVIAVQVTVQIETGLPAPKSKLFASTSATPLLISKSPRDAVAMAVDAVCDYMEDKLREESGAA